MTGSPHRFSTRPHESQPRPSMRELPYTFDNGAGEWLTISGRIQEPDGERIVGEARAAPGAGPPMHVHHQQEEAFTVVEGRLGYQIAGWKPAIAAEGETVVFPAGQAHRFWNAGESDLRCSAYLKPAGNTEFFLGALFASQKANGGRRPALLDVAFLAHRYRTEYSMVEIPMVVQRLLFPVLIAIGRVMGRYAKYADAPEPYGRNP